ncbi:hypothetical protein [uncultured Acetatifactor sp.]|uniref:hypothetical protein n=1 Tax=uncultured Acetatifactor sp. TaxID=1671927 RepID=UPI00261EACF8|nr:hypothetical protein [uncultured Acetatifactor sp.]
MKLENWNEYDKAPAKTRYVRNAIELSERRIFFIVRNRIKKVKKEMATLTAISIAIQVISYVILLRRGLFREPFHKPLSGKR